MSEQAPEPLIACDLPLGREEVHVQRELVLSGWTVSPVGVAGVAVQIGERVWNASYGLDTPWLAERFAELPDAVRAGYHLRIDVSMWPLGFHYVTVATFDKEGGRSAIEGSVEVRALQSARDDEDEPGPQPGDPLDRSIEHRARYDWAARVCSAGRVLDAACGSGSGTALLAEHAHEVVGVDFSPGAIEDARRAHGDRASFVEGDLRRLPFEAGEFDAVVCFEALAHVAEPDRVLDELHRVLAPGGTLIVSCPNPESYPPGNPLHLAEIAPADLERALGARFANVAIYGQQTYFATLLGTAATLEHGDPHVQLEADVTKLTGTAPGGLGLYAVAVATDLGLPPEPSRLTLGEQPDYEAQQRELSSWRQRAIEAEAAAAELRSRLQR